MLALQQHIPIPVLPHWAAVIWAKARDLSLVRPADVSFGPAAVWELDLTQNTWERMIQDLVKARKVTVEAR